jgi:hypothetical protein
MLKTKSENWVAKFLELNGLDVLFEVLVGTSEEQANFKLKKKNNFK